MSKKWKEKDNPHHRDLITCMVTPTVLTLLCYLYDRIRKRYFLGGNVSEEVDFMNAFNGVTSYVFSNRCFLHYCLSMPVGFNSIFRLSSSIYKLYMTYVPI